MEDSENQFTVLFEDDSEYSVSLETATSLMTIVGAPSLKALIQHSLALLRDHLEIAYPKETEVTSTSEHWCNIARQIPNGLNVDVISGFINGNTKNNALVNKEYTLQELMSEVTEENKHDLIDFGKPLGREIRAGWAEASKAIAEAENVEFEHQSDWDEVVSENKNLAELKLFDAADFINDAEDAIHYLKITLEENDPESLAEALSTIFRSEDIRKLTGNGPLSSNVRVVPTLKEMIAQCDLTQDRHPDLVSFERESLKGSQCNFKTVTVSVQPIENVIDSALEAFSGKPQGSHISFVSYDLLWQVLAPNRMQIVKCLTGIEPMALPEIALQVDRDLKAVDADVQMLLTSGILEKDQEGKISFGYDAIQVDFMLQAGVE